MQAFNPYLPSYEYVPDGEPYVFGDRLYVYGSHDKFNGKDFCLGDYVCWSAPVNDLGDWRYEGVIYRRDQDPRNKNRKSVMNAPDVQRGPDGRYYLYYVLSMLTVVSVAVADKPEGPYEFYGYVWNRDGSLYGETPGEVYNFDPGIFMDDDGRVYLYTGFSPEEGFLRKVMSYRKLNLDGAFGMELEPDMLTIRQKPTLVAPGPIFAKYTDFCDHPFYEASSMRKIGDTYYFVYSSTLSHELCYATGKSPLGPFTFGGTLISIGDVGYKGNTIPTNYTGNTHGGMVELNGQWYIFYHRQTNKQKCARQGCAEPITILPDGSIPQVEVTSCGLNGGPLIGKGEYEARIACNLWSTKGTFPYLKSHEKDKQREHPYFTQSGADRESDPDQYIANLRDGATVGFKYFKFDELSKITVTVRGSGTGRMEVRTTPKGDVIAEIPITPASEWEACTGAVNIPASGVSALYFTFRGAGSIDLKSLILE